MILLTPYLLGLPESQATETNNAQGRKLARTTDGRDVLRRFARMVSWLTETEDAHRAAERAWTADEWQPAFEAAVDAQRELEMALWGEAGPLVYEGGPEAQRVAWTAWNTELELLSRRVLDWARLPLRSREEAYTAYVQLCRETTDTLNSKRPAPELARLQTARHVAYAEYRAWVNADHVAAMAGALD